MEYHTEIIPFKDYVKGVLPNEWYATWPGESLKAGALAVKMYAWSTVESKGYVWDCNWDQVYKPWHTSEATDKAVDDTWEWVMIGSNGSLVKTYYDDYPDACASRGHECMSQWWTFGSDLEWYEMLFENYEGILIKEFDHGNTGSRSFRLLYADDTVR